MSLPSLEARTRDNDKLLPRWSIPAHSGSFRFVPVHSVPFRCLVTPQVTRVFYNSLEMAFAYGRCFVHRDW